jgi:hypothetical protein
MKVADSATTTAEIVRDCISILNLNLTNLDYEEASTFKKSFGHPGKGLPFPLRGVKALSNGIGRRQLRRRSWNTTPRLRTLKANRLHVPGAGRLRGCNCCPSQLPPSKSLRWCSLAKYLSIQSPSPIDHKHIATGNGLGAFGILNLFGRCHALECSDDRDRIYALLGCAADIEGSLIIFQNSHSAFDPTMAALIQNYTLTLLGSVCKTIQH